VLGLKNRGLKPKTAEDRGGYLLRNTIAACVIAEPFFIDNNEDLKTAIDKRDLLVKAYANGIEAIAKSF
ncbi:MAG: N-acetylmuramoyl-L-alanine amidase, partial [Thermodesulfobacteriota bacterium]|nr:N-acetylmuramoyl-L-alanine amidase [Thermodesulfobacteriota bacterium]